MSLVMQKLDKCIAKVTEKMDIEATILIKFCGAQCHKHFIQMDILVSLFGNTFIIKYQRHTVISNESLSLDMCGKKNLKIKMLASYNEQKVSF